MGAGRLSPDRQEADVRICNAQGTSPGASSTPDAAPELRLVESGHDPIRAVRLAPRALQAVLRQSIPSVLDLEALDRERQQERADAGALAAARRTVHEALLDRTGGRLG